MTSDSPRRAGREVGVHRVEQIAHVVGVGGDVLGSRVVVGVGRADSVWSSHGIANITRPSRGARSTIALRFPTRSRGTMMWTPLVRRRTGFAAGLVELPHAIEPRAGRVHDLARGDRERRAGQAIGDPRAGRGGRPSRSSSVTPRWLQATAPSATADCIVSSVSRASSVQQS